MSKPKFQHYVPQFYLRYFSTKESIKKGKPKVLVFDKKNPTLDPRLTMVKNVCGKRYLYSPLDKNGERDWSFEESLSSVEYRAAQLWKGIASETLSLTNKDIRKEFSIFLGSLHLRNKFIADTIKNIMDLRDKLFGGPVSPNKSSSDPDNDKIGNQNLDPTDHGRYFVQSTKNGMSRIAETFYKYSWSILQCQSGSFVTTDRPITFVSDRGKSIHLGPGTRNVFALFPITPQMLLVMHNEKEPESTCYLNVNSLVAYHMNQLLTVFAVNYIFSSITPQNEANS